MVTVNEIGMLSTLSFLFLLAIVMIVKVIRMDNTEKELLGTTTESTN